MSNTTTEEHRLVELRDAELIAQTFLNEYPRCFHLLAYDVAILMVEGFILRRVIEALRAGRTHDWQDANTLRRLVADVFNAANHMSAAKFGPSRCPQHGGYGFTADCADCQSESETGGPGK